MNRITDNTEVVEITVHGTEKECEAVEKELKAEIPELTMVDVHKNKNEAGNIIGIQYELELDNQYLNNLDSYISNNDKVTW